MGEFESVAVVMAGGSGTRFWPLSRKRLPKQYLPLMGNRTLIQQTVDRISTVIPAKQIFICSSKSQEALLKTQLPNVPGLILEPLAKNTAPCVMLSVIELLRKGFGPKTAMVALPADHYIGNPKRFTELLKAGIELARKTEGLVTFGIQPTFAHTGYGYIQAGKKVAGSAAFRVKRFTEKPDRKRATAFLKTKQYYWNSGIFVWTLGAISKAFQSFMPKEWDALSAYQTPSQLEMLYKAFTCIPIDIAILEKSKDVYVLPAKMDWSDIGSWSALYDLKKTKRDQNVSLSGQLREEKSKGCLVSASEGKKVALVGVENLIVVENGDTLLIADRSHDQLVRNLANEFDSTDSD